MSETARRTIRRYAHELHTVTFVDGRESDCDACTEPIPAPDLSPEEAATVARFGFDRPEDGGEA